MSEQMNSISKDSIRTEMNLVYTMLKFISMLLDMVQDTPLARETLTVTADGMFQQAAELFRDINIYADTVSKGFQQPVEEIRR